MTTSNFDARMVQQLYATFERFLRDEQYIDCHLIARPDVHNLDMKIAFIKAHKVVMAAASPYFDRAIRKQPGSVAIIDLSQFDQSSVEQLIEYVYKGQLSNGLDRQALIKLALHCEMLSLYEYCTQHQSPVLAATPPQSMDVTPAQISNGLANTGAALPILPMATSSSIPSAFQSALKRKAPDNQSPTHFEELMKRFKLDGHNSDSGDNCHLKALLQSSTANGYANVGIDIVGNHADSRFVAPQLNDCRLLGGVSAQSDLPSGYPHVPEVNFQLQQQIDSSAQTSPAKMHIQNYLINRAAVCAALNHNNTQQALMQAMQQTNARDNLFENLLQRRNLLDSNVFKRLQELATNTAQQTIPNDAQQATKNVKKEIKEEEEKKPADDKDEGWCRNKKYIEKVNNGFMCTVCKKVYGRYNSVSYHVTIYHRNPPIQCEIDGCQFTTREARYIHFHKYYRHGIALPKSIDLSSRSCPFCRHIAKSPAMLEKHIKRHVGDTQNLAAAIQPNLTAVVLPKESDEDGPHNCDVCSAAFQTKNQLYEHTITSHERPVTYDCHLCSRRTMPGSIYQQHMQLAHQQNVTLANSVQSPMQSTSGVAVSSSAVSSTTITHEQVAEFARQLQAARRLNNDQSSGLDEGVHILAEANRKHSGTEFVAPNAPTSETHRQ